jgi:MFS family permease
MLAVFALVIHNYPYFVVAAGLSFLLGLLIAPIMIASNTIVHSASDNAMMAKTFSSLEIIMHLGFLLFMFISSVLAERFSHTLVLTTVGILVALLGFVNLVFRRKIPWLE